MTAPTQSIKELQDELVRAYYDIERRLVADKVLDRL